MYAFLGKLLLVRLMVFSVQESVHNQFNVIILLEENSESGNLSLTERLKAGCL